MRHLGSLQLDPIRRVERTEYLVLWSRLGPYDRTELERLAWEERSLVEWDAFLYPVEHMPLLRARMRAWARGDTKRARTTNEWLRENAAFRRHVLRELRRRGPLLGRELDDRAERRMQAGDAWWGSRSVGFLLDVLAVRGEVAVVGRVGGQRLWDLAERWYPRSRTSTAREAERALAEIRLRALGIVRSGPGLPVRVEGVPGTWVVDPEALERADEPVPDRITLLSPFDQLIHDRARAEALFDFHYRIEIYVPKAKRKFGYYVLPVLSGDRLVGRIDPEHDRRAGVLRVHGEYAEPGETLDGLDGALASLAEFLGAESVVRAASYDRR